MSYVTDSDTPDYIKLVTLDEFDGERWKPSPRQVRNIANRPGESSKLPDPPGLNPAVSRTKVRTTFEITNALDSRWLPSPYPPSVLNAPGDWGYDPDTLDIVSRGKSSAGLTYEVNSLRIAVKPAGLESAVTAPEGIFSKYTELPPTLPQQVVRFAKQQTARAKTPYDKAVALQQWFRNDFTYDLSVERGHGGPAMLEFLADRRGYCEQFAATMAIMARALGIPARVGVGYMPGIRQPDNRWVVTAHDSHAWPELYFSGYGWVRFEPTPQAQTGTAPPWTVPDSASPTVPSPDLTDPANPRDNPSDRPSATPLPNEHGQSGPGANASAGSGINPVPFLVGAAVLFVLAVPFLVRTSVRRVRLSVRQPSARLVERVWQELADVTVDFGFTWDDSATPRATGARLRRRIGQQSAPALNRLVLAVERTRYAPEPSDVTGLPAALREVSAAVRTSVSPREQLIGWLLVPSLWRRLPLLWGPVTQLLDRIDSVGGRIAKHLRHPIRRRSEA
jgi:transglutaminase-like putative cysteine protease